MLLMAFGLGIREMRVLRLYKIHYTIAILRDLPIILYIILYYNIVQYFINYNIVI